MKVFLLTIMCFAATVLSQDFAYDRRCPEPNGQGTCGFCGLCNETQICCPNGCGSSCMTIPSGGPEASCPPDRPFVYCFAHPCSVTECPQYPEATCTSDQCGGCQATFTYKGEVLTFDQCNPRCPPLVDPAALVTFQYDCTSKQDVGSVCTLSCPKGEVLHGVGLKRVVCQADQTWTVDVSRARCAPPVNVCPADKPLFYCFVPPCLGAECPAFPQAKCVADQCGGCNFDFYLGDTKLTREQCIVEPRAGSLCSHVCKIAKCPSNPNAICKPDCNCRPRFYHPQTLKLVRCYRTFPFAL